MPTSQSTTQTCPPVMDSSQDAAVIQLGAPTPGEHRKLGSVDRRMLAFLVKWAPYGQAPDEESFAEFGLRVDQVHARCIGILQSTPAGFYSTVDRQLLVDAAQLLAVSSAPARRKRGV